MLGGTQTPLLITLKQIQPAHKFCHPLTINTHMLSEVKQGERHGESTVILPQLWSQRSMCLWLSSHIHTVHTHNGALTPWPCTKPHSDCDPRPADLDKRRYKSVGKQMDQHPPLIYVQLSLQPLTFSNKISLNGTHSTIITTVC